MSRPKPCADLAAHRGLSRRYVLAGLTGVAASAALAPTACGAAAGSVALSRLGVDRFSDRDQWQALRHAFETAAADGLSLVADPDAIYRHDGPLTLDGVSFDAMGCAFLALSDGPQALRFLGNGWRIANLRVLGNAAARSSDNLSNGIWVGDEGTHTASDFVLENIAVDRTEPGRGVAGAGIMFSNAHRGRCIAPVVRHSLADGIHMTAGSSHLAIHHGLVEDSGDDAVAVVSYRAQHRICHDIAVADTISRRSAARGFSVVGGLDIAFARVTAEASSAAGVYLYSEESFDTYGVARCTVKDAVLIDCVTGKSLPPGFSNGAILIGGREGSDRIDGETVTRAATDCVIDNPTVNGAAGACTAAISLHQFAVRPHISGGRITGPPKTRKGPASTGIEIDGHDVTIDKVVMKDIIGLAVAVLAHASGTCRISGIDVDGSRLRAGSIDSYVYVENAPKLDTLIVSNSHFAGGPDRLSINLLPPGRMRLIDDRR